MQFNLSWLFLFTIPFLTMFVDTFVERPALQNLWMWAGFAQPMSTLDLVIMVWGQALIIFAVAYASASGLLEEVINGRLLRAIGLLLTLAVPAMVLSTLNAETSIASLLPDGIERPSLGTVAWEHLHIIFAALFSTGAHLVIWSTAPQVVKVADESRKALRERDLKAGIQADLAAAGKYEKEAEAIVIDIVTRNAGWGDPNGEDLELIYRTRYPKVAEWIKRYKSDDVPAANTSETAPQQDTKKQSAAG